MNTGRYGYGCQFECYVPQREMTLDEEASGTPDGFKAVVNRLMEAENWDRADEIYTTYKKKWGDKI